MRMGTRLAGFALAAASIVVGGACATEPERAAPRIVLGGSSPLVGMFERAGRDTGLPPELLAAISYVETRLRFADSSDHGATSIGLFGMSDDNLVHGARLAGISDEAALTDPEASILAGAALLRAIAPEAHTLEAVLAALEPALRAEVTALLVRGLDAQDVDGRSVVVAARPQLARARGLGEIRQALGAADYAPANWVAASTANYKVASRGLSDITHVVIHTMQGSYNGTISWFKNPDAGVSAHYNLRSTDGDITQMVLEKNIGWHDACFNTTTVGIEHEGYVANPALWYTEAMYASSAKLTAYLADKYSIPKTRDRILGHGETADCSTHTDPGPGWDWPHYMDLVTTGGAPMFGASNVTVSAPASLIAGEHATVTITITNDGNTAWDLDTTRLGTTAPQDRDSSLFVDGDWMSPRRATSVDARIAPGETGTFTFEIVAPAVREPTVFDEAFQLVQEGVAWFGPEVRVILTVLPAAEETDLGPVEAGCNAGGGAGSTGTACGMVVLGVLARRRRRRALRRTGRAGL